MLKALVWMGRDFVYQHPQHGAVIVWDLDMRPEGPYHPLSPESEEPALLS